MKRVEFSGDMLPPGIFRCESCGEYNGATRKENLRWNDAPEALQYAPETISVRCLCQGIPCPRCKDNLIHRPISNSYDARTNSIGHWPYFAGMMPCRQCHEREEALKNGKPKA